MAYDAMTKVVENGLTATKATQSFDTGKGSLIDVRVDITDLAGTVQVVVQESDDNISFTDSVMTRVYDAVTVNDLFVFKKQKAYHRFNLAVSGTSPSVNIELNQR
jgi:hypothetical protein